jgi:hypothetical protein
MVVMKVEMMAALMVVNLVALKVVTMELLMVA